MKNKVSLSAVFTKLRYSQFFENALHIRSRFLDKLLALVSLSMFVCCSEKSPATSAHVVADSAIKYGNISIEYVGNMGVLISGEKTSVLIDGLHEYYGPEYLNAPDSVVIQIINGYERFAKLELALFTHYHRDHYSVKLGRAFLETARTKLIGGSPQVIDSLKGLQVLNTKDRNGEFYNNSTKRIKVGAFNIPHTWQERHAAVQNIGYLVCIDNINILHIGDADTDTASFKNLIREKIDVMIVPIWFLMDKNGIQIIREIVKPSNVIATHISPDADENWEKYKLGGMIHIFLPGLVTLYILVKINALQWLFLFLCRSYHQGPNLPPPTPPLQMY